MAKTIRYTFVNYVHTCFVRFILYLEPSKLWLVFLNDHCQLSISANPKAAADSDPHFIVNVKGLDYAICFDVMGKEGDVYRLLYDKYSGQQTLSITTTNRKNVRCGKAWPRPSLDQWTWQMLIMYWKKKILFIT